MASSPSSQRLLLAAAWIGTAVVAYSIGSFRTPPAIVEAAAAPSASTTTGGSSADSTPQAGSASDRPIDGGRSLSVRSQDEILANQPLGDYLKRVLTLDDDIKRTSAFLEVLETLTTTEQLREAVEAVVKSGRGWGRGITSREYSMIMQKWTTLDAPGAADYAVKNASRDERFMAMNSVLRTWTRQDPNAALAWAQANGTTSSEGAPREGGDGNYAVAMVVAELARKDPEQALRVASTDGDSRAATRLGDNLTDELFKQRGAEATRDAIMAMPQSRLRDTMLGEYADRLAQTDGPGATRWAASLPEGAGKSRALAEAVSEWAERDPAAAGSFLNTMPPSADTDPARERFAREISGKDPVGAISWASTMTDPRQRQNAVEDVVRNWVRRDAENARTWVMQSTFSDETKQRLLTTGNNGGGPGFFRGR